MHGKIFLLCFCTWFSQSVISQQVTSYDLFVKDTTVNYTGKTRHAIAINGQIPGPTIELKEGDTALIRVHNQMQVTTSIHWHGILIPNRYDGVPGLTTFPIEAGKTWTVKFPVRQSGTYWYHSHTMTQEQIGLTGPIVIHARNEPEIREQVIVLNDWTNMKPFEVWRLLKRQTDWFAIHKNSVQSYGEAIVKGHFGDKVEQEWKRMPAMDISDVKYNTFLINGAKNFQLAGFKSGEQIKLRIINASSSSYFWLQFSGGKMQVTAADGQNVKPVEVDKFLIATAETYDVMIQVPADGKYELRATAQDISGHVSAWFGEGRTLAATDIPKIDYFQIMHQQNAMMSSMNMMKGASKMPMKNIELKHDTAGEMPGMDMRNKSMNAEDTMHQMDMPGMVMSDMQMGSMDDSMPRSKMEMDMGSMKMKMYGFDFPPGNGNDTVLYYRMLKAANDDPEIPRPSGKPDRLIELTATGNMFRYVWSFNNVILSDGDKILIKKGEHVQVIFHNNTMMEHPLHLHGHFFRLLNGTTLDEAPLKHTFNLLPMATDTIDFAADEEKDWFFHCHALYHMLSGMAKVFHYDNTLPEVQNEKPELYKDFLKEHGKHIFFWGNTAIQSQGNFGIATLAGTKWELNEEWKWNWKKLYESETMLRRFIDRRQYLAVFIGADNRREKTNQFKDGQPVDETTNLGTLGLTYFLPLLITAEGRVDTKGHFRLQLSRQDFAITKRTRFNFSWNTDKQYSVGLGYVVFKNVAISGNYDSDYGWGAGISLIY